MVLFSSKYRYRGTFTKYRAHLCIKYMVTVDVALWAESSAAGQFVRFYSKI